MTWADVNDETIRVAQQKTGRKLTIPLHRDLVTVLTAAERNHATIVNTEHGRPFSVDGFSQWIRDAITAAGLALDCQPHGHRKAAGRRLAEAGCATHEIMAVLGHKTLAEAERYTREADQSRVATEAMIKLEGRSANRIWEKKAPLCLTRFKSIAQTSMPTTCHIFGNDGRASLVDNSRREIDSAVVERAIRPIA